MTDTSNFFATQGLRHCAGHKETAQIAAALFADTAELLPASLRVLPWQPRCMALSIGPWLTALLARDKAAVGAQGGLAVCKYFFSKSNAVCAQTRGKRCRRLDRAKVTPDSN